MARYLLMMLIFAMTSLIASAQTSLSGKVTEEESGEPVLFGSVALYKNGNLITGTDTDLDGNFIFSNIDPGKYDIEVSFVGLQTQRVTDVIVFAGKSNKLDVKMSSGGVNLDEIVVTSYKVPLIQQDNTTSGGTITGDQIRQLPTRNINALAANTAGLASQDEGDDVTVKGSRKESTFYFVDNVRVFGALPPESEIDQLQVITGGIEAQYGDVTGGIISIITKGPSAAFSGGVEAETSKYLDAYNNSLVGLNLSGPIWKKKDTNESILGFRISGRYTYKYDDDPNAIPVYRVTDSKLAELEEKPIIPFGTGGRANATEFVRSSDVDVLDAQPYEENSRYDLTAKIDARLSKNIDVSLTGYYGGDKDRFTPNENSQTLANWRVFNSHNNPIERETDYRGSFRFRHRLGSSGVSNDEDKANKSVSSIQNASYTIQLGYEKNLLEHGDYNHGDNYFDYGYVGKFDYIWENFIGQNPDRTDSIPFAHLDYRRAFQSYTPGTVNPVLAAYNNAYAVEQETDIIAQNGQVSDLYDAAYEYHTNVGWVYDRSRKQDDDIYTFNLNGGFDFLPGGSENGRHNIQFGIMVEQRTIRKYDIFPWQLWQVARQQANRHILGVDVTKPIDTTFVTSPIPGNPDVAVAIYAPRLASTDSIPDSRFYREVRNATNQPLDQFVNVDALTPNQLRLDMFSGQELNDQDLLDYYGYDYLGNPFDGTFDDFFTTKAADGARTFPIAPFRPIYAAGFIQDKFTFKDIIFRLGLRLDRYDANTKVLKDPYSIYEIMGASDFHGQFGGERPGNIGDDFKVYVSSPDGETVRAYRDGDQWYFSNGTPANDGNLVFGGDVANPKFKDQKVRDQNNINNYIKSPDFDPNVSFKDYEVQVNWMPRLAFSFPISDEANFFAHYDILVQRPTVNNIATARTYYYFFEEADEVKNNPALRPERTVDYEVGFQQKLSNTSALKIAAYYKEMRDMIQRRTYLFAFPLPSYVTFDNQDFGTVKGFTFQYDLRRTGNVSANIAYTLQFADGTGSDANSQTGLTNRGNLRTLYPLSFDERHRIVASMDYRYSSGKKYNGPRLFGSDIFADAGINVQAIAVSGRPYTKKLVPRQFDGEGTVGSLNGARLPWNFTINLRIDKNFSIGKPGGKPMDLNVYLRVSNLLDTRNITNVYPASGSATDDGYLTSTLGQNAINQLEQSNRDLEAFYSSYQWRLLNPNFYSLPRRIFIGAIFGF